MVFVFFAKRPKIRQINITLVFKLCNLLIMNYLYFHNSQLIIHNS